MRSRVLTRKLVPALALGIALVHCGAPVGDESTGVARAAIIGGVEVDDPNSPVLFLRGPQGFCSATLIAPTLVVTARHCIADLAPGNVVCTPSGDLASNSPGGGLGADDSPADIAAFLSSHVQQARTGGTPDANATAILSTQSTSTCKDDLAFVVLDRVLPGLQPVAVRLTAPTELGEDVSLWGYGLTDEAASVPALRLRDGVQVVGIGPDQPTTLTQEAPVRAVRLGPGSLSCNGDSGGPVMSASTGAVVAIISFGEEAASNESCPDISGNQTTGPRLAEYATLAMQAFNAAGALPILESGGPSDASAGSTDDGNAADDLPEADAPPSQGPPSVEVGGSACTMDRGASKRPPSTPFLLTSVAMAAIAIGRRRR